MIDSILTSTKKILGISEDYTAFDVDVITHINSVFTIMDQLGVGPTGGFMIEDDSANWSDFDVPRNQLNLIRTYLYLRVRALFDPPTTSYLIEATNKQIQEYEYRLSYLREEVEGLEQRNKEFLEHYGVKGMRWGFRNKKKSPDSSTAKRLSKTKIQRLSNAELKAVNERMNLERNFKKLNPSTVGKGANYAKNSLAVLGAVTTVYAFSTSPPGKAAVALGKRVIRR